MIPLMLIRPLSGSSLPGTAILVAQELPARGKLHEITAVWITPHLRTAPLLLLQRVALLHSHLKHVIKRAADDEELGFQYRLLTR